ncbi:MAG: DUF4252 domain-containing protein [Rubricoccaceae bacterium]|nr:DUF4252 domain-containing protein [Rubricoccaceae bacterium]
MTTLPRHAMTRLLLFLLTVAVGLLFAPASHAQPALDLSRLDSYFGDEPRVEVNLSGAMLGLAAAATAEDEPGASALIEGLNAVTVRVYDLSSALTDLAANLTDLGHQLEADGWQTFVRVRGTDDDNEDVWIYVREAGDAFGGLVVMALDEDEDEAAFVVIDGLINPEDIARLSQFGIGD